MKKVDCNSQICVLGAQFEDIYEVARCACLHEPKDECIAITGTSFSLLLRVKCRKNCRS